MTSSGYVMAIDQGTTSTRVIVYDHNGNTIGRIKKNVDQHIRFNGWIEHDANQIWSDVRQLMHEILINLSISSEDIITIGITNQRETTVLWDKNTGEPIAPAIGWQSKQSNEISEDLKSAGLEQFIYSKTGLWIDSYFSATKIMWLVKENPYVQMLIDKNQLAFGTIDSWLLWKLTDGNVHATDYTNASRTMLFNIHTLNWDEELLDLFNIDESILPEVKNSSDDFGSTVLNGIKVPIGALAGDQQAALVGHKAFNDGDIKSTYGTGAFIVMNTGNIPLISKNKLLTTIAYGINGEINYALEGSIFVAGSAVQWLEEGMEIIDNASLSSAYAYRSRNTLPFQDIYLVPAFTGLGAPYWDQKIRGAIFGLTRSTRKEDLVRATIEALAYQTKDILDVMIEDSDINISSLFIDGGAASNEYLHEFMANLLQIDINRPTNLEMTSRGIAYLAGLKYNVWDSIDKLPKTPELLTINFEKELQEDLRNKYIKWQNAVMSAQKFAFDG
ncbi:glycerol kinase GlpK [Weissella coleopterorum]|uniref:ATP:glycerol 3-phosphotransferase n=1 Tax=Weissella coleopterorum TaxID=2714949 RepID=A0A6G8B0N1_9LACO|nr:glycerol kinase GlpK [Weissella coleopterorum]QIL50797.1 glycerol kinase GlpK [Weissella coleopterorum]